MPSCAGFLEPKKSRLGPSKSTFNAKNFVASLYLFQLISVQFAFEMRIAALNRKKIHKNPYFGVQSHPRSLNLVANDFLLLINSNLDPISHHYWDTATCWLKIANFSYPLSFSAFVRSNPLLIYGKSFTVFKTRVFQAVDGEDLVILACTVFDWSTRVTDKQTDRQTDRQNCDG